MALTVLIRHQISVFLWYSQALKIWLHPIFFRLNFLLGFLFCFMFYIVLANPFPGAWDPVDTPCLPWCTSTLSTLHVDLFKTVSNFIPKVKFGRPINPASSLFQSWFLRNRLRDQPVRNLMGNVFRISICVKWKKGRLGSGAYRALCSHRMGSVNLTGALKLD